MPLAVDTVVGYASNPGSTLTAATMNTGDSTTVRNGAPGSDIWLDNMTRQGATEGYVRVRSPLLHDNVRGIAFTPSETPTARLMPPWYSQRLKPQDNLIFEISGGTAETDAAALGIWYADLGGASSRLHLWGDISGIIKHIKPIEIDVTTSGTSAAWVDQVITTTEDLTQANTDYAMLGYVTDVAVLAVGLKGADTSSLRVCGPGVVKSEVTSDWFIRMSQWKGRPYIPVWNSANKGSTYCSVAAVATSAAVKVTLIMAELTQNLAS